mgnify:FL=1
MRTYFVGVFEHDGKKGPKFMAYVRYFNPSWVGCCTHNVSAENGATAKREAIGFHKLRVGCGAGILDPSVGSLHATR